MFFFFNDTATTEIYTLSLHDALPIFHNIRTHMKCVIDAADGKWKRAAAVRKRDPQRGKPLEHASKNHRSEEHTSELQSLRHLVCRLLLEKKKQTQKTTEESARNITEH